MLFSLLPIVGQAREDFEQLPPGAAVSLRGSLLALLARFGSGPAAVRSALCAAVAELAAHTPAGEWECGGVVPWLAARIAEGGAGAAGVLVEVLQCVPEEVSSLRVALRPDRRRAARAELAQAAPAALRLLAQCADASVSGVAGSGLHERTLLSLATWVRESEGSVPLAELSTHPVVAFALASLQSQDDDILHGAVEALCEVVRLTTPTQSGVPDPAAEQLASGLLGAAVGLQPRFVKLRDEALAGDVGGEAEAKSLARFIIEAGDTYYELIARGSPDAIAFVQVVLDINAHPEDSVCSMTYMFWQRLARAVTRPGRSAAWNEDGDFPDSPKAGTNGAPPPPPPGAPPGEAERRVKVYAPAFMELVRRVCGRVAFPAGAPECWDRSQREEHREARHAVCDTLQTCADVAGGGDVLLQLLQGLEALGRAVQPGGGGLAALGDWRPVEAALYCVRSIGDSVPSGLPVAGQLMQLLPAIPREQASPQLRYTALLVVQRFSAWLARAAHDAGAYGSKALLEPLCGMVLGELAPGAGVGGAAAAAAKSSSSNFSPEEDTADAAASCLARLSEECGAPLLSVGALPAFVEAFKARLAAEAAATPGAPAAARGFAVIEDMATAVCAVARHQPPEGAAATVVVLVDALGGALQVLLARAEASGDCYGVAATLDGLHAIFKTLKDHREAVSQAFGKLWPLLQGGLGLRQLDQWSLERLCRVLKEALRAMGPEAASQTLGAVCPAVGAAFAARKHEALLYVATEYVRIVERLQQQQTELGAAVAGMLDVMLGAAAAALAKPSDFSADPFLADDTFLLSSVALRRAPMLLLRNGFPLQALTASAAAGATVQHRNACSSVLAYLTNLVEVPLPPKRRSHDGQVLPHHPDTVPLVHAALAPVGGVLVRQLLAGVAGALPENRVGGITDVLVGLASLMHAEAPRWVGDALMLVPENVATTADKAALYRAIELVAQGGAAGHEEHLGRQVYMALYEFKEICLRSKRSREAVLAALELRA